MSTRSKRPRREHDETTDSTNNNTAATTPVPSKRQRKETNSSKTPLAPTPKMSTANTTFNIPSSVLKTYQQLLPENPQGIAFLFNAQFSEALDAAAKRVASEYMIAKGSAIEEFRRLLAIKVFTVDKFATKISPTPLSKQKEPLHHFKRNLY
jgi:hypothetical protein